MSSYSGWLNAVLGDTHARGKCLSGFPVLVGEDGHLFHLGDEESDEEPNSRTTLPQGGDRSDVIVGVLSSAGPF